jgi:nitrogen PTS system EIIA component
MSLSDYIVKDLNRVGFNARNKKQALTRIAEIACTAPQFKNETPEKIRALLAEREEIVSTGVGKGVAIPHARLDSIDDFVVFVLTAPDGVDFDALDGRRVTLFFVVFAPSDKVQEHLKLLAGIANALGRTGLKKELLKTRTADVLYEVLVRYLSGNPVETLREDSRRRLLILVLYYEELLNDLLEYLIDVNVEGATIIRSEGMGAHISTLPLFAGFMGFMREDQKISHTVMALIPQQDEAEIVRGIEAITGDLDKTRGAMVITLEAAFYKGTMNML